MTALYEKMWFILNFLLIPLGILSLEINGTDVEIDLTLEYPSVDINGTKYEISDLKVLLTPEKVTAAENTQVVFRCDLEDRLDGNFGALWKFEPVNGTVQTLSSTSSDYTIYGQRTLVIKSFSEQHVGNYYCQVCDCSTDCEKKSEATLLKLPPEVNQESGISEKVVEGTTATLPCRHFGRPAPVVRWMKKGRTIPLDDSKYIVPPDYQSLVITQVKKEDQGDYSCVMENKYGEEIVTVELIVINSTRFISTQKEYKVRKGDNVTLVCEAETAPMANVKFRWFSCNREEVDNLCPRSSNSAKDGKKKICTLNLCLKNVQQSQNYSCVESLQNKEYVVLVTVMDRPEPPSLKTVNCGVSSHNVELRWTPGNPNNSPLLGYTIRKRLVNQRNTEWHIVATNLDADRDSTSVQLRPNTETELEIFSSNDMGDSDPSNSVTCRTPPAVPSRNPFDGFSDCTKGNPRTVKVTWTPLSPEDFNGPGCAYEVSIPSLNIGVMTEYCTTSTYTFTNLPVQESYGVTIRAKNQLGYSSEKPLEISACYKNGRVEPHNLKFTVDGLSRERQASTQIQRGTPVVLECTADGNPMPDILWLRNGRPLEHSSVFKTENQGKRSLIIGDPKEAPNYSCFASNTECAIMHNCIYATLAIREQFIPPPQVTNLKVLALSPNSIYVQWRRPPQMLYITGFEVIVSDNSGEGASRNYTVPPTTKVAKINGLTPAKDYLVSVSTIYEDGRRSEPLSTTCTLEMSPDMLSVHKPELEWRWRYNREENVTRLFVYWLPDKNRRNDEAPGSGFFVQMNELDVEKAGEVTAEPKLDRKQTEYASFKFKSESLIQTKAFQLQITSTSYFNTIKNQMSDPVVLLQPAYLIKDPRLFVLTAEQKAIFDTSQAELLQKVLEASLNNTITFCRPDKAEVIKCFGSIKMPTVIKGPDLQDDEAGSTILSPNNDLLLWSTLSGKIMITNLKNSYSQTVVDTGDKISYLVSDWFSGTLYWVGKDRNLFKLQLQGKISSSPALLSLSESAKIGLTVDSLHKRVYFATETSIFEYAGETESLPLLTLPDKLKIVPGTLNWFQNRLFWINRVLREPQPEAETFTLSIFDFETGSWDQKFIHVGSLPLRAQIYEDQPLPLFSKCPNCSHSCIPGGNGKFECVCPFGLGLSAENRCEGLRIGLTLYDENIPDEFSLMAVDIGNVSNPSFQLKLQDSRLISANPGFVQGGTEAYCIYFKNASVEACVGVTEKGNFTRFFRSPSDLVMDEMLFSSLSGANSSVVLWYKLGTCIKRYDSERNESLTIYCNDCLDLDNVVVDAHNWILFWRNSQTGNVLKRELAHELESPIISRDEFNEVNRPFRITCDPKNKIVYWLSAKNLNARGYDEAHSGTRVLRTSASSASNLIFNQGLLFWVQRTDSNNLIVLDLAMSRTNKEFISKYQLFSSPSKFPRVFPLFRKNAQKSDNDSVPCSHFRNADNICWCPPEYPILTNGTTCLKVEFLVAVTPMDSAEDGQITLQKQDSTLSTKKIVPPNSIADVKSAAAHFAASRDHAIICWQIFNSTINVNHSFGIQCSVDEKLLSPVLNASHATSALHLDGHDLYFNNGNGSCMSIQSVNDPEKALQAICQPIPDNPAIAIDSIHKLIFWCAMKAGDTYIKFQSMDGLLPPTEIMLTSALNCRNDAAICRSIAVDECKRQVYIVHGAEIKRVDYSDFFTEAAQPEVVVDLGDVLATSLQFYQNRLFWIGSLGQKGEFIETIPLPDATVVRRGKRVPHRYQIETELNLIQMSVRKSSGDSRQCYTNPCLDSTCKFFCFPATWNSDTSRCYCSMEFPCDSDECECLRGVTSPYSTPWIWVGIVGILSLIAVALVVLMINQSRRHREELDEIIAKFLDGVPEELLHAQNGAELAEYKPFESSISSTDLVVHQAQRLGGGEFGNVYRATYRGQNAAAKTLKPGAPMSEFEGFLKEIKIMAYLGDHENIIKFYGAQVDDIDAGKVFVVLELCPRGDLEGLLRKTKSTAITYANMTNDGADESAVQAPVPYRTMLLWCYQIANGMEFMVTKNVIHGDLATRNVLAFDNDMVKLSDFGFARNTYGKGNYTKCKKLAYRWAAIETLEFCEFSHRADVWSFGVTCWEIFSLGLTPFANQNFTVDFPKMIREGLRLPKPDYATNETYKNLIMPCWNLDPEQRPSFTIIKAIIRRLLGPMAPTLATVDQDGRVLNEYSN